MKAKIERGAGFRGSLDYALGKGNACEIVGGTMSGTTARDLAAEFALSREARPNVKRPVWHTSLSLPPGETIDSDRWAAIVDDFMDGMDLGDHQYVAIRHHDTELDHIHIIASRIGLDGDLYLGRYDARRAIDLTQRLEETHGLTRTKGLEDGPTPRARPSKNEIEQSTRTGDAPPRLMLQEIIDAALAEPGSVFDVIDRIEAAGARAIPNVARTGKMNGFAFEYAGIHFKGSDLGKAYTWKGLQQRGIEYEQDRDGAALRERASRPDAEASEVDRRSAIATDRSAGPAGDRSDPADGGADNRGSENGRGGKGRDAIVGDDDRGRTAEDRDYLRPRDDDTDPIRGGGAERYESRDIRIRPGGSGDEGDRDTSPTPALDGHRSSGSVRPSDWNPVANRVHDLAAGAYPDTLGDLSSGPVTPAIRAKGHAWTRQHGGLQSPGYRLTLMSRVDGIASFNVGKGRGSDGSEKVYDAEEVRGLIPYLSAHNLRGRDVYLTPMDPGHHYIVVDDMTEQSQADLLAAGYAPALVQESSAGNRQAVLKIEKGSGDTEQQAANAVVVDLNRRYGDPNFSGVIHPFRMAGFSNKKAGRGNAFTRILDAAGDLCTRTMAQLDAVRKRFASDRTPAPTDTKRENKISPDIPTELPAPSGAAERAFDRARAQAEGLASHMGWSRDESRLDYRAAATMAADGWDEDEISGAILSRSSNLVDRHRDPVGYAIRTAQNATVNLDLRSDPEGPKGPEGM